MGDVLRERISAELGTPEEGSDLQYRRFGRLGWQVSEIGHGMWGMGGWSGSDDEESALALTRSAELGCNFFDTALAYGEGHSEALLGDLVRSQPEERLYTATKIPPKNDAWPSRRGMPLDDTFPPDHIDRCVRASLENSGLDSFDLVQLHVWEDDWVDDERWIRVVDDLRSEGLLGGIGLSLNRWEPWNGVRAVERGLVDSVQVIYNLFDQSPEDELLPACIEHDVAVVARVPFDEGSLAGALTADSRWPDGDWRNTYFGTDNLQRTLERIGRLQPLAPEGTSLAELALRFILEHPAVSTVIPGMRTLAHVEENIGTSDGEHLPPDLMAALRPHRWDRRPTTWSD